MSARGTLPTLRARVRAGAGTAEILIFRLGRELFGAELAAVQEAADVEAALPVPDAPPGLVGIIRLHGRAVPLHSPARLLRVEAAELRTALVLAGGDAAPVAVAVDDVEDVHEVDLSRVGPAPSVDDAADAVVVGIARWRGELVTLIDVGAVAAACVATAGGADREVR